MLQTQNPYSRERIDALTSTLAGMDARQRQQYAAQHRNDPAVIAVALNVSNILNAAQRNKAMQAASTPMPKVVDQEIANMALPEDQGIGQLAAPNIARMADGGIAGYGDGDDVPKRNGMAMGGMFDFAQRSEPVVRMAEGGVPGYAAGVWNNTRFLEYLKQNGLTAKFAKGTEGEKKAIIDAFGDATSGPQKAAPPAPAAAATASNTGKAYELGQKVGPTVKAATDKLADIGTTKTSKLPLGGGTLATGVLSAGQGLYEGYKAGDFYNDPNVSAVDKALQATRTATRASLPVAGAGFGSLFTPAGTVVGGLAGTGVAALIDEEGEALKAWRKANPQATPEQTKKAAAKLAPVYSPDDQSNAEAKRLGLKVNPNTMSKLPEAADTPDTGVGGQGGVGGGGGPGMSAQGIKDMYALFAGKPEERQAKRDAIRGQLGELAGAETLQAQNMYKQLQDDIAARGEYGKGREAKLKAREERIGKEEGQSGGLALLEAGLAMMAGTSPNAFANIGQGAMAGTAAYRKSMEKIADARDKLEDAYGRLEDVRFNQKNMDTKELREAKAGIDKAANAGLKSLINFAGQELDMDNKEAMAMFGGAVNLEQSRIAAGPGYQRNAMLAKRFAGDDKKMAEFTKVQKQVMADLNKDVNYNTATSEAAKTKMYNDRLRAALASNPFLSAYAMNLGFESEPTGTVRTADIE